MVLTLRNSSSKLDIKMPGKVGYPEKLCNLRNGKRMIMGISRLNNQPNSTKALETQSAAMLHAAERSYVRTDAEAMFEGYASD